MVRQRGGLQWKQGSDGCIFLPAVECAGQDDKYSADPKYLSKVVPKGLPDEHTENFIATHFPDVVRGKGVLISVERCIPRFSEDRNKNKSKNVANKYVTPNLKPWMSQYQRAQAIAYAESKKLPCQRIDFTKPENYTNFVMEKYANETFFTVAKTAEYAGNNEKLLKLLRRTLNAAVALVPDNGPWILGYDFHIGNVFVKMDAEPYTSLADWGRVIIIENPNDPASISKGLTEGIQLLRNMGFSSKEYNASSRQEREVPIKQYFDYPNVPQFLDGIRRGIDNVMTAAAAGNISPDIQVARLTTLYGILQSARSSAGMKFDQNLFVELLTTKTQQEIVDTMNKHIQVPGIDKYIDLETFFPKPAPPPAPVMPASLLSPQGSPQKANSPNGAASVASQNTLVLSPSPDRSANSSSSSNTVSPVSSNTPWYLRWTRYLGTGGKTRKQKKTLKRFRKRHTRR